MLCCSLNSIPFVVCSSLSLHLPCSFAPSHILAALAWFRLTCTHVVCCSASIGSLRSFSSLLLASQRRRRRLETLNRNANDIRRVARNAYAHQTHHTNNILESKTREKVPLRCVYPNTSTVQCFFHSRVLTSSSIVCSSICVGVYSSKTIQPATVWTIIFFCVQTVPASFTQVLLLRRGFTVYVFGLFVRNNSTHNS